ncbi:MAG: ABC transporter permease [Oscillospiraceae bacterium]
MNIIQSFKMAFKSITDNKARSILTMLGIIIGVSAVIIMVSVVQGANQWQKDYYEKMGTNKISVYAWTYRGTDISNDLYAYCLGLDDLVMGVTPDITYSGSGGLKYRTASTDNMDYQPQIYLGSDQFSVCNNFTVGSGRDISYLDVKKYNQVVVLGAAITDYLFGVRDPIGETVTIGGNPFTVIGVYVAKDPDSDYSMDNMAVVPYSMNRMLNNSSSIENFSIKASGPEQATEASTMIQGFLSGLITQENGYFYVQSENQWIDNNNEQTKVLSYVVGGIAGISLLVGGIGIMNIMLVTVTERTREIGIRKAIGGSRRSIILQFLIEAAVICCCGGILGVALGYLGTVVAGKLILNIFLLPTIAMTIGAVGFSVILGIIFGMYPAVKASGLQPVEALRAD